MTDFEQQRRIRKAEFKRKMRAITRSWNAMECWGRNPTIDHHDLRRSPFHVAK